MKVLLLTLLLVCGVYSRPLSKSTPTTPEDCDFYFGNTERLRISCILNAMEETKGMYMNLVRTLYTPEGPVTFPLDRPNNHGDIYESPAKTITITTPQGPLTVETNQSFLPSAEEAQSSD